MSGGPAQLLVASNRGPVSFTAGSDGTLVPHRGDGGLVTGLASAGRGTDTVWVCAALSDGDRTAAATSPNGRVDLAGHDTGGQAVRMLNIAPAVLDAAYNNVANKALWFTHHGLTPLGPLPKNDPAFGPDWASFQSYNRSFAKALATESATGAKVVVQDYHLSLAPRMLRELRPDLRIGHFTHTPWASLPWLEHLPADTQRELIAGLLGSDHAGFHTERWASAFLDSCSYVLGAHVEREEQTVTYEGRTTSVGVHPLGVDARSFREQAARPEVQAQVDHLRDLVGDRKLIVRVDRVDPSKNISRGLMAYRQLLDDHPEWRGNVMLAAVMVPSRQDVPEYQAYTELVKRLAADIHRDYGTDTWMPVVVHERENLPLALAAYRLADVGLVNVGLDGMNLVAKEMPSVSDDGVALVLSRDAGAFAELGDYAIPVSPMDVAGTAEALHTALSMAPEERRERSAYLAAAAAANPPAQWLADQVDALDATPAPPGGPGPGTGLAVGTAAPGPAASGPMRSAMDKLGAPWTPASEGGQGAAHRPDSASPDTSAGDDLKPNPSLGGLNIQRGTDQERGGPGAGLSP